MKLCVEHVHIPWSDMEKFQKIPFTNKKFSLITTFLLFSVRMSEYVPLSKNVRISVTNENVRICVHSYDLLNTEGGRRPQLNASM